MINLLLMTTLTLLCYIGGRWIYRLFPNPLLLPVITGTALLLCVLFLFEIPYESYIDGAGWLETVIGVAVVALAYPLYRQLTILKKYRISLLVGTSVGSLIGVFSTFLLTSLLGVDQGTIASLLPKSVTTAVAIDLAESTGGESSLAAIFVTVAGVTGTILYSLICKWFRIDHVVGRGVAVGSASHAIGTAKALEFSEEEGAISSVAMTLCAIMVSILIPVVALIWF
ncbi:LrgB family protein [Alkalihalobacillus sp. FSL R5-0424]